MKFENDGLDLLPELGLGNTPWRQIVQLEVLTFVTLFFLGLGRGSQIKY